MAVLDTITDWTKAGSNILNAASPFLKLGGSIYNLNNKKDAINSGFNAYKGYADKSLDTLKTTYDEGKAAIESYQQAGTNGLNRYQSLLNNPGQITSNPGYQFEFNQGKDAVNTSAGTGRMLQSGNRLLALDQFGQDYASTGFDKALSRELPMVQAGQNATGQQVDLGKNYSYGVGQINNALGNAANGKEVGTSAADNSFVTDLLGLSEGGNPIANALDGASKLSGAVSGAKNLLTGGAGATAGYPAGAVPAQTFGVPAGTTTGVGGATPYTGASNILSAGGAATGGLPAWYTAGATPAETFGGAYTTALGGTTPGAGATAGSTTLGGFATSVGIGAAIIGGLKFLSATNAFKGGASESAKLGKMQAEISRQMQADPSGGSAMQFIDKIINNQQWANEGNGDELGTLFESGMVSLDKFPSLSGASSRYDLWNTDLTQSLESFKTKVEEGTDEYWDRSTGRQSASTQASMGALSMGPAAIASAYGLPPEKQKEYAALVKSGDTAAISSFKSQYLTEANKKAYATQTYQKLRGSGYTGDLSKLEKYLGMK